MGLEATLLEPWSWSMDGGLPPQQRATECRADIQCVLLSTRGRLLSQITVRIRVLKDTILQSCSV